MRLSALGHEFIGKSIAKVDALDKATGGRGYTVNIRLPGMLHAKLLRSPIAHGLIRRIDVKQALGHPGVKAVLTYMDVPRVAFNPTGDFPEPPTGERIFVRDTYILDSKVRFVGDPVAAVAAISEEAAEEALDLIEVEYEELPPVFDAREAMRVGAPKIHDVDRNIAGRISINRGNIEAGFKEADAIFEDTYKTQRAQAVPLEPHACVCSTDAEGKLTVWSSTQSIFVLRSRLAEALSMPKSKIKVVRPSYIGGGFGTKVEMHAEAICALLALKTGRPVKLVYSRSEDFLATSRHPTVITLRTGVKKDGTFTAREAMAIIDCGAYARHTHVNSIMGITFMSAYRCPNVRYEGYCVYTNQPPSGSLRGFGGLQPTFAVETQIDQIAEELGIDPLELRLKNSHKVGDPNPWTAGELPITSYGLEECIRRGAERIGWHRRKKPSEAVGNLRRGIGAACLPSWVSGTMGIPYIPEFSGAVVKIRGDGGIELVTACIDIGGGQSTVLAQMVAEEFDVPIEAITLSEADTDVAPGDTATHATRVTYVVGSAVKRAAEKAKERLLEDASKILGVSPNELDVRDGSVLVRGDPRRSLSLGEVVKAAGSPIFGEVRRFTPPSNPVPCAAHFADVEVDIETGLVRVLKVVAAHDVGKAINPQGVEGQIEGGVQLGIEHALTAELVVDDKTGKAINTDLLDYKVLTAKDMPEVEAIIVETMDPTGPFGAKGVGEPPLIPVAAAIGNAIYNAVGVRIKELPITPEKILRELGRQRKLKAS